MVSLSKAALHPDSRLAFGGNRTALTIEQLSHATAVEGRIRINGRSLAI